MSNTKTITRTIQVARESVRVADVEATITVPDDTSEADIQALLEQNAMDKAGDIDFSKYSEDESQYYIA